MGVGDEEALAVWRRQYLGKTSLVSEAMDSLASLPNEEKPLVGRKINEVKATRIDPVGLVYLWPVSA